MLRTLPADSEANPCVIFAGPSLFRRDDHAVQIYMYARKDLLREGYCPEYSCITSDWDMMMGNKITETPFTKEHLPALLAELLRELSMLGFTQEERDRKIRQLEEASHEFMAETEELDEPQRDEPPILAFSPIKTKEEIEEQRLLMKLSRAEANYVDYCHQRELKAAKEELKKYENDSTL